MEEIERIIGEINTTFGTAEWQPIRPYFENNYTQAIAGMKIYDVLLVNAVIDGMNLVAKEGPVVNTKDGVLILSESTGAYQQLRNGALGVAPADLEGTMQAMYQALTMTPEERARRAKEMADGIRREDISNWLCLQIEDLAELI
jgi:trehalose 6-phosphate synthase